LKPERQRTKTRIRVHQRFLTCATTTIRLSRRRQLFVSVGNDATVAAAQYIFYVRVFTVKNGRAERRVKKIRIEERRAARFLRRVFRDKIIKTTFFVLYFLLWWWRRDGGKGFMVL